MNATTKKEGFTAEERAAMKARARELKARNWNMPWISSANTEFNVDLGYSRTAEETSELVTPIIEQLPPIAAHNADAAGTGT